MDAEYGDVGTEHGLANDWRQYGSVVANVTFTLRDIGMSNNAGDTLNDVILAPGVIP
jgi:hypothetical protein